MRKKEHAVGDTIYLRGIKGVVKGVDEHGRAIVHAQNSGKLLGSAPAYKDLPVRPEKFDWPEHTDDKSTFTVIRDDYIDRDFDEDPIVATDARSRNQAYGLLERFQSDYLKAERTGDAEDLELAKKAIIYQTKVLGNVNADLVFDGKCGIDGCGYGGGPSGPSHFASLGCRSGRHNHCTCDTCF